MHTLYVAQQGCHVCRDQQKLLIKKGEDILGEVQIPLLEQVLVFGRSQITTQAIQVCLQEDIPIAFLSRMGYCYGRIMPIERGYRQLSRYQQQLTPQDRLIIAQRIVEAKLKNSRVFLMRQYRTRQKDSIALAIKSLNYFAQKTLTVSQLDQLMGIEGSGAVQYFQALGECIAYDEFKLLARSRRPPTNPTNALLSFGYQILWNHLLTLIEMQGLDPYYACLHQGSERHAALASDLIEEFRVPFVDSLVLWLINTRTMNPEEDFRYQDGGCFLNAVGRKKFLSAWLKRMEQPVGSEKQPRWDILTRQIRKYKQFVYNPIEFYTPYEIQ
ncbi:CRISPR-associated protein, Cas1 family [Halothece sp. PCC 7418]|uniref:CRISPR-associated endonuclease Cas1 n=1 Tax=Halothece sp. (strain PCC 7418) TaxID=65093 RepID=UPI0002A06359|nr:CRISPR-associated endonuclease Cas1 [Halothece sp. PCC 7418]AFZ43526.1 CRISPR-associated protein, Cas1 family [Halothece sp. PCC 7418]